jgi:zinc protease
VGLAEAEAALDRAVAEFLEEGVDDDQLERIRTQIRAALIYEEDDIQSLARSYGMALTSGLTIADIEGWPEILKSVTEEEILDAAARVFDRTNAVTGWLTGPQTEEVLQ